VGYTIVDSIDSLLIMGFEKEYFRARDWCRDYLNFDKDAEFNTFEVSLSDPLLRTKHTENECSGV
jgi:hypothetical protein